MAAAAAKKESTSLSLLLEVYGLEMEEELSAWPRKLGQKESGLVNGPQSKKKHGGGIFEKFRRASEWTCGCRSL